jgi:hypothetical protein
MMVRSLSLITLVSLTLSVLGCQREAKSGSGIVGKWEATLTYKRTGNETKMLWEFLPDGTFQAAPFSDPTAIVDKDAYRLIDEGQSVKIKSQLVDDATCVINGNTMTGETPNYIIKFKRL